MSTNLVKRGYVTVATGTRPGIATGHVSAIVSRQDALSLQKRFGGIIVNVAGLPYRTVRQGPSSFRVLSDDGKAAARALAQSN